MNLTDLPPVANHVWQSTMFAGFAGLLAYAFRRKHARVRHWIWFAASVKFLVPLSLLIGLGREIDWPAAPHGTPAAFAVLGEWSQPFSATAVSPPIRSISMNAGASWTSWAWDVWICGLLGIATAWCVQWRRLRAIVRRGQPVQLDSSLPAVSCPSLLEPGVFGLFRPVLLLPEGILARLTPAQWKAVIAHELCHVRSRDNLIAAIHMFVETVFWFHPLVWWIGKRMVEERERACDEEVLRGGAEPRVYAEGILRICSLYRESPLACAAGVTGSGLQQRIEQIMSNRTRQSLTRANKLLIACAGCAALAVPLGIGLVNAAPGRAQSDSASRLAFEVASVKANKSGSAREPSMILPGGRFTATNNTLRSLILNAYGISTSTYLLEGGPGWIDSVRYDVDAKADPHSIPPGASGRILWEKTRLMLQTLLADRFQLVIRRENREMPIYQLVVARNGPRLTKVDPDCSMSPTACHGFSGGPARLTGTAVDMYDLSYLLGMYAQRPVRDSTGVAGLFDLTLQWNPFAGRTPPPDDTERSPETVRREGPRPDFSSLPTLFTALEEQLGLKLDSRKGPVEIYVIERVERPTEN